MYLSNLRQDIFEILMFKHTFHFQLLRFKLLVKRIKTDSGRA